MLINAPQGIKLATGIVGLVAVVGGLSFGIARNAITAHETAFRNEKTIITVVDTLDVVHEETHDIQDALSRTTCILILQLTDSTFTPIEVDRRCPR